MKNKLKTRRAASKRYQITKTGKILHKKPFRGHILEKKSSKRKRFLRPVSYTHLTLPTSDLV